MRNFNTWTNNILNQVITRSFGQKLWIRVVAGANKISRFHKEIAVEEQQKQTGATKKNCKNNWSSNCTSTDIVLYTNARVGGYY